MKIKVLVFIASFLVINVSVAGYNNNIVGEVSEVLVYTNGQVTFRLANQPTSHPGCNPAYFAIDNTLSEAAISRLMSRLLSAHATKVPINIGYDDAGDCANTYIRVHRVG